ncbi:hypothetical protein L1887_22917 [Cichorium endivia]|nr:hypothetical protein L1887_22917 [Cichorium endivia]
MNKWVPQIDQENECLMTKSFVSYVSKYSVAALVTNTKLPSVVEFINRFQIFVPRLQVDAVLLAQKLRENCQVAVEGQEKTDIERVLLSSDSYIVFEASNSSGIKIVNQREAASSNIYRHKEFNL